MSLRYETGYSSAGPGIKGAQAPFSSVLCSSLVLIFSTPCNHLALSHLKPLHTVIMIDYTKIIPIAFVLAPIQEARSTSGMVNPAACTLPAFAQSSPASDPHALLDDSSSTDNATSMKNQDGAMSHAFSTSFSCRAIQLFTIIIGQIGFLAHQFLRLSDVVDVLSSSFETLVQTTDLEIMNLCATVELVKQDVDAVKDQTYYHEQMMTLEAKEFATLIANQQRQIDELGKQLHEERESSRDSKKILDKLTSRVSRDNKKLDVFHRRLRNELACQIKDQVQTDRNVIDLRKELDAFHERLHGQLTSQVKDQIRTENDVADLRKDISKTLSLYHTRISALEFALSQARPPPSPQDIVWDSKPVQSTTFVDASTIPKRVLPGFQHLPTPKSAAPKKQRSGISISARSLRFIDRESIYIQPSPPVGSKAAGIPMKFTTPKTFATVDSIRHPVTVKSPVSSVLPSSKILTPGTRASSAPKEVLLKNLPSKDSSCDNRPPRESATLEKSKVQEPRAPFLKKSGSATMGKVQEPRAPFLKKSGSAVKDNAKVPKPLKNSNAAKGKARELSNNRELPPSSSPVTPATTLRALRSTSRPDDVSHGIASQLGALSSLPSLEVLDAAVQLHSLGNLRDPLPSLDSMSWLDVALDGVANQPLSSSSSLEALDAAMQCHSLGDLDASMPSLDSMSWLDECHEVSGQTLRPSFSTEALEAAVQLLSLDELCGTMPSLDSMSFLDNDTLPIPPFKNLGWNKARSINCHREPLRPSSSMKALDAAVQFSSLDDLCGTMHSLDSMSFLDDDALAVPPFKSLLLE
ncbi:uncharacterized protein EDB93DRAFT_1248403 [Suillus bovinus]|uniref:uncharacterized protein n=1 Tax=Suillus bovinus TaxID=48563 RepID=UPI001B86A63F|nr:uncharacterized protein EDB93DRAFT_1248403 [Suillus bovinus]KAG2154197.1 hypothetical protein EDB93DRAFT_1248403 [Suillus bovinus]